MDGNTANLIIIAGGFVFIAAVALLDAIFN